MRSYYNTCIIILYSKASELLHDFSSDLLISLNKAFSCDEVFVEEVPTYVLQYVQIRLIVEN